MGEEEHLVLWGEMDNSPHPEEKVTLLIRSLKADYGTQNS